MNNKHFFCKLACLAVIGCFCLSAYADSEKTAAQKRADSIYKLLNESSGAKQVMNGASAAAQKERGQAIVLYEKALSELDQGNDAAAAEMLNQSSKKMFEAIRLSTPTRAVEEKSVTDYKKRRESVSALKDAFDRISEESKESEANRVKVDRQLDELVAGAEELLAKGETAQARIEIDKAYHLVKVSIDGIRSGQTLVRSLNFETPKDEYLYEIDRNDTHSMLVGLLIDEQKQSDYSRKSVTSKVSEANELRAQAESYAAGGAYEQAIELLEQSTKQLVRAIRSAGIYIPG